MSKLDEINSFDYSKLNKVFSSIAMDHLGLVLTEANGGGKQPEGTFISFDIISPYIPIDEFFDVTQEEAFETVVSFTLFDISKTNALFAAQALRKTLTQFDVDIQLRQQGIIIAEIMPTNIRAIPEQVFDKHMVGFDVRLRLQETYTDGTIDSISDVEIEKRGNLNG
ncbi:MAG: phage neck terminator protein [Weissella hellenica]|uniref:phage neck terminator protein n=1 Tax=Weissella hellenica TaxID=46256 RepID=UPI003F9C1B98